ncbi:MAG: DNA polymerase III subunit gamma/tau [Gammaproteobacteria bacterium]|nr:DNA polymerase III subunit gamma/tau [Gammaproteobacteria bacterium]NIR97878.1 DNA polymerase III subunit gamma/tau [Gammaproteobacteria bacterium]NIT63583.1 DNA polymerase III subunit gamma/tau [Gammaproteobacteria bacterium]NIV20519.1 DNA polymerase III subunit gamma/tau [Gammaproteobacteria bacterium]NIX11113.1 DNA polymerase III subunit gamma/tau [Gammaproteobacteria bacterium]
MSYQVLARKWRPRNFQQMVGQEHVLRALVNALDHDRIHHAFLFTGTRGVGKTTLARILAKSLNCERGVGSSPCGECAACREIDEGRFVDLIEVDAASRTKVEDTRELLENVQYAPTRGRYKVYLVDEVHMLSDHSFNALLKTLEEPPPHVKFLLATTDPQKLPVTILSRCLQFNLKPLPAKLISGHLASILDQEAVGYDAAALAEIARAADGSMRDALSLLDQAIAHGGGRLVEAEVRELLGTIERGHVVAILKALAAGDGHKLLEQVEQLAERAPDFLGVLAELLSLLHRVALAQTVPEAVDDSLGDREVVRELAAVVSPEDVQLFYQIGLLGRRDLPLAPDARSGLEMVLLRMLAFRPLQPGEMAPPRPMPPRGSEAAVPDAPAPPATSETAAGTAPDGGGWESVVETLGLRGAARELAVNSVLQGRDEARVYLVLDPACEQLASGGARQRLEQALQRYYQAPLKLDIRIEKPAAETPAMGRVRQQQERHQQAVHSIEQDAVVRDLQEVFDAEVRPELIQPVER